MFVLLLGDLIGFGMVCYIARVIPIPYFVELELHILASLLQSQ